MHVKKFLDSEFSNLYLIITFNFQCPNLDRIILSSFGGGNSYYQSEMNPFPTNSLYHMIFFSFSVVASYFELLYWSQGAEHGLEHHLHRGRALAALNYLLSARVYKLKSDSKHRGQSETSSSGQTNVQSDVQTVLAPITETEESLLSSVRITPSVSY